MFWRWYNGRLPSVGTACSARLVDLCLRCPGFTVAGIQAHAGRRLVSTDMRGLCRKALSQTEGAAEDLQAALKLQPNNREATQALQQLQAS